VAWSYFIYNFVIFYPGLKIPGRLIDITLSEIWKSLSPVFFCALGMGGAVWGVGVSLPIKMTHWGYLAIQIPFGIILYIGLVMILKLDAWLETRRALFDMVGKRKANI
jgi:hypothetical protein